MLGLFWLEQVVTNNKILLLILPVITRWTAHYLSLRRLLQVEASMQTAWIQYKQEMIECAGPKADARAKALSIQCIVENRDFWHQVKK